jgi:hypothetical protein
MMIGIAIIGAVYYLANRRMVRQLLHEAEEPVPAS